MSAPLVKIKEWLLNHSWELAGLLLIFWVVLINKFPKGYIVAGEDTFQRINLRNHFSTFFYDWEGRASLFYTLFYFLEQLHISETAQLSWYLGLFLVGAYLSFLGFLRIVFGSLNRKIAVGTSLFYALNLYTLYVFTYSWGYSQYQILYVFIPLLVGAYVAFLRQQRSGYACFFLLLLFFGSSGFSNPAFAVAFALFFAFLTLFLMLANYIPFKKEVLARALLLVVFSVLVSAYWILPLVPQVKSGVTALAETNSIDLTWWLQKTSTPISETLRLGQYNSGSFFPENNPYPYLSFLTPTILVLSFLPFFLVMYALFRLKHQERNNRKLFIALLALLVVFVALNARIRFPFEALNNFLFHLPGFNTMRSYEKIAIFTPFLLTILVTISLLDIKIQRVRSIGGLILILILALPLPFYFGKLQQNMSFVLSQREKDFQESSHSFLVKIPKPYYEIQKVVNEENAQFKIATLPYNTDKIGWVSYPDWKMRGNDVTQALYKAPLISPNTYYLGQWLFAKDFNEKEEDPIWMPKLLGLLNSKYLIYHKDVHELYTEQSEKKIRYLKERGDIQEVANNKSFTLFRLADQYMAPYVYVTDNPVIFKEYSIEGVSRSMSETGTRWNGLEYRLIHPKKIEVSLSENFSGNYLFLNEQTDPLWEATYDQGGKKVALKRDNSITYANAWMINKKAESVTITLEYRPMRLFFIGAWISGITLVIVLIYSIYLTYEQRKKYS